MVCVLPPGLGWADTRTRSNGRRNLVASLKPQQEFVWWVSAPNARAQSPPTCHPSPRAVPPVQAHIQAADALLDGGAQSTLAGKAYFVTNDDPRPFWGFMGDLCEGLGYGRPRIR